MSKAGVGESSTVVAFEAGVEAARAAVAKLDGQKPNLALVFATAGYQQDELLGGIREILGNVPISGCSGEGIITQKGSDESSHAVSVLAISSKNMKVETYQVKGFSKNASDGGRDLAEQVNSSKMPDAKMLLLFVDGITGNCTEFLASLQRNLKRPLMLIGGAAGSIMEKLDKTFQYHNGSVFEDTISAVLVGGEIHPDVVVSHGCEPIGLELTVTKANGSYVDEIDGRPAWEVFKEYLDGDPEDLYVDDLVHLCIGEQLPAHTGNKDMQYIVRTPVKLDAAKKALFIPGQLKEGAKIIMTRRNPEKISNNAVKYAKQLQERNNNREPLFILQFDCAWRGRIFFGDETSALAVHPIQKVFGNNVAWSGFHTYGEIAPIGDSVYYHNVTVAICAVYDN